MAAVNASGATPLHAAAAHCGGPGGGGPEATARLLVWEGGAEATVRPARAAMPPPQPMRPWAVTHLCACSRPSIENC